jgi:hypothetical protein
VVSLFFQPWRFLLDSDNGMRKEEERKRKKRPQQELSPWVVGFG